ncbi:KPN_02809 family neutral zinc metallopeptidase [Aerococcus sanguinicola]|uniref:KPN_02809 family neutral zinc metallopeptidase n=1 Tax=unclassified Aerococcus TaxID=2618060 RepID=UPI0008A3BD8F|nr:MULTISPECIES: neutral zinc metallopeptidase [unclassified Aerococcus]MDK6234407.1 neutral zinc metallopeptidase [Aerococcus sp. UMB10185]MDK6805909.1 neutral zinc metallopeptidase [Aerococcus sp. UMB7834]MDK6856187.1 neutral zinc metallopeptidase [Aerococcus sp. UMB7533]MDK8503255.1 neutral zinc metallopeptidase [Aerococcus sp. UMB1112A]OFN01007.1 YpfJ protein, zinc metalloprotease superfamily [Aerococcus sp. HMSC062A02]
MKWDDLRRSKNVDDRRGQSMGRPSRSGGSGLGGLLSLLLMSRRGGGKWLVIIIILMMLFGGGSFLGGGLGQEASNQEAQTSQQVETQQAGASSEEKDFLSAVLGSTEDFWSDLFQSQGQSYDPATLVLYTDHVQTGGCGFGSAQAGPFYCPGDQSVYIDLSFYRELKNRYQAPGDFAMAYVLAHEVGHHIQNELGIMDKYQRAVQSAGETEANQLSVRLELQADYLAGVWAHYAENQGLLESGDIQEALQAANAVGDDTLQEAAYGQVVPDSFTHGSAKQRQAWFERGYKYGDLDHGDTFNTYLDFEK